MNKTKSSIIFAFSLFSVMINAQIQEKWQTTEPILKDIITGGVISDIYLRKTYVHNTVMPPSSSHKISSIDADGNYTKNIIKLDSVVNNYTFRAGINGPYSKERTSSQISWKKNIYIKPEQRDSKVYQYYSFNFYNKEGKLVNNHEFKFENRNSLALKEYILGNSYYVIGDISSDLGVMVNRAMTSKLFIAKMDANGNLLWEKDIAIPYNAYRGLGMSSVLDKVNKVFYIETKVENVYQISKVDLEGHVIDSYKLDSKILPDNFKYLSRRFNSVLQKSIEIDIVKNNIKEKGVPKKLAYLKSNDLLTNVVTSKKILNDKYASADVINYFTLKDKFYLFYKLKKKKTENTYFLTSYDRDLNEINTIELTNEFNKKKKIYRLKTNSIDKIAIEAYGKLLIYNTNLDLLGDIITGSKLYSFQTYKNHIFIINKGDKHTKGTLYEIK